jgi:hypothetical protein
MKVNKLFSILLLGIILGCNSTNNVNNDFTDHPNDEQNTSDVQEYDKENIGEEEQNNILEINIPEKDTDTSIHDQLIWFGIGGDYDINEGHCDSCSINDQSSQGYIELIGFNPNQELELTFYKYVDTSCDEIVAEFLFTKDIIVNQNGYLKIITSGNSSNEVFIYIAKDKNTQIVEWKWRLFTSDIYIGQEIRVNFTTGEPLRVRTEPYIDKSTYIASLEEGVHMIIVNGPVCPPENEYKWWYVKTDDYFGWIAEGSGGDKFIESVP